MSLLRLITWPYVRRHKVRMLLTTAGIVLGVAVFVGMHTANQSVLFAFHRTVDRISGKAELQITAGETGFTEDVLEQVQAIPDVRVAVPIIEAPADTGLKSEGNLLILAVDMTGDRSLRDYDLESGDDAVIDDPLVFLAQPDSLMVTREFARRNNLKIGSRVPMRTMVGDKQFTVRGIMKSGGLTQAFGGNLAVMDIYAAQTVFGRGRRFDRIDLALNEGVALSDGRAAIEQRLGPGFQVQPPSSRGQQLDSVLRVYSFTVNINSAFALLIGMFIIYNSFSIAVTQRRHEIGVLRALGATRSQIRNLFLIESGIVGVAGSIGGLGFGVLLARVMSGYISALIEGVYGVAEHTIEVATDPRLITFGFVMGVATSLVAGFLPARSAARVDPIQALQKGKYQVLSAGENRARQIAAWLLGAGSVALLLFGHASVLFYTGFFMAVLTMLLLSPTAALWLTRALRPALKWLRPVEGALAADSLIQAPKRTSATVAALMLSLALVVSVGGIARASYASIMNWTTTALNPDLFVTTAQALSERNFRFPASFGDKLRRIPGVDVLQSVRTQRIQFRGQPVMVVAVEARSIGDRARRPSVEGPANMYELAGDGKGVILSDHFAGLYGLHYKDVIDLPTPSGVQRLPVLGLVVDWSDQQGVILMDRATYVRYWNDDSVNVFRIYVKKGVLAADVRARVLAEFAGTTRLFVLTNQDVRSFISNLSEQWLGLSYAQIAIAVLVAILGIVNTLTVSIIDRRRELGVMRAVGGLRNQVRRTIWMEALTIGLVGLVLGLAFGSVTLHYVLEMTRRDVTGQAMAYTFPFGMVALLFPIILGAAFVSALWPAESALRGSLVEALEYE
jgi:putative ABC transport system permease protein